MTREEALNILKTTRLCGTDADDAMSIGLAKWFLEGYEQGVMDSIGVSGSVACHCHKGIFALLEKK